MEKLHILMQKKVFYCAGRTFRLPHAISYLTAAIKYIIHWFSQVIVIMPFILKRALHPLVDIFLFQSVSIFYYKHIFLQIRGCSLGKYIHKLCHTRVITSTYVLIWIWQTLCGTSIHHKTYHWALFGCTSKCVHVQFNNHHRK